MPGSQTACSKLLRAIVLISLEPQFQAASPQQRSYWPTGAWRSASPEAQGMSTPLLERAAKFVEYYNMDSDLHNGSATMTGHADAFMVVKGGYVVAEHYWGSTTNETMHDLESTTKSISSALIAHAIKRGFLSVKTPASKFYDIKPLTPEAASTPLLLENIVSMSGGLNGTYWKDRRWFGHCCDWNQAFRQGTGPDGVETGQFVAEHGLLKKPGTSFVYSWANTGLASGMFTKSTGMGLAAYATQPGGLFEKIGIRNETFRWMTNKYAENEFDGSSYHQLHNLARFGLLMVSGGSWDGEQLLDEEYVEAISQPTPRGVGGCPDYRRFFWHKPLGGVPKDAIITWGGGGQFVVAIPSLDLVVLSMFGGRLAKFVPPPDIATWPSNATEFMPRKSDILADTGNIRGAVGSTVGSNDPLCYGGLGWNWTFVEPVPTKTTKMGRGAQMPGGASCGGSGTSANFSANPPSDFLTTMVASVVAAIVRPPVST